MKRKKMALAGERTPVCMSESSMKRDFIAKVRGLIFDGHLKNKQIKL